MVKVLTLITPINPNGCIPPTMKHVMANMIVANEGYEVPSTIHQLNYRSKILPFGVANAATPNPIPRTNCSPIIA